MTLPPDFKRYSAEDFIADISMMNLRNGVQQTAASVMRQANALLESRFSEWAGRQSYVSLRVEAEVPEEISFIVDYDNPTHTARLFAVEKLEGKDG